MKLLAADPIGVINPPDQIKKIANQTGAEGLGTFITFLINLIIAGSALIFIFMILLGGLQWITSGGDKEKIRSARGRITHALIGFVIVAAAALLAQTIGSLLGFNIFNLSACPPGEHIVPGGGCHS